jgi:hypothetical protein
LKLLAATGDSVALLEGDAAGLRVTTALAGSGAQCVAAANGSLYAGSRGSGLWRSADGGRTWDDLHLPQPDVFSVAVSTADGAVYAGCEPSMLFRSDDGGSSWRELERLPALPSAPTWSFPPRPWTSHVRWIAPSPHEAGVVLAGIELGGLMRSGDRGETWEDRRPGAKLDVHSLAWHPAAPGRAYEAAGDGTAWSDDGGRSWAPIDAGRDRNYAWAIALDADDPDTWYASVSTGPFAAHGDRHAEGVVYRFAGERWETVAGPFDSMPYALCHAGGALFAGLRDGRILAAWEEVPLSGDPLPHVVALIPLDTIARAT